ncbi:hypothetical protein [Streptomyces sindenensis]|uniref:hypothetical protein n=1 Tax=Streptomyces sindenensis TaxID=67363 RepID=UPI001678DE32|nr:hypothetical protein [Streptomyces sindenensis]GGP73027.1 hypothetical protein GCM10010231_50020 [Streptomyces sindenensis]
MALFRRRKENQESREITDHAVEPFGTRFAGALAAPKKEADALISESLLWQLVEDTLEEGEVQWVTCGGMWVPADAPPLPVRFYLTDHRVIVTLDSPSLPARSMDLPFDDIAVFDPEGPVGGRRPKRIQYLVITSESGRPEDGVRTVVEFNLDDEGHRFIGTATKALRDHGGLHGRLERARNARSEPSA